MFTGLLFKAFRNLIADCGGAVALSDAVTSRVGAKLLFLVLELTLLFAELVVGNFPAGRKVLRFTPEVGPDMDCDTTIFESLLGPGRLDDEVL